MGRTLVISGGLAALLLLGYYFAIARPQAERLEQQTRQTAAQHVAESKAKADAAVKAKAEEERQAAARQAAARGAVIVRTNPAGAEVMLGALAIERAPLRLNDLKLGKYTVKVRLDGYADWIGEVVIKENEFAELNVDLVRDTGAVSIASVPLGLEVEILGDSVPGEPPSAEPQTVRTPEEITLPTGSYQFTYRRPGWPEQTKTVRVNRNQRAATTASFPGGDAAITSRPSGAEVWINGQSLGTTPLKLTDQPPGAIEFELRMDRYLPATGSITLKPKGTVQQMVKLERVNPVPFGQPWTIPGAINLTLLPVAPGSIIVSMMGFLTPPRITLSQPYWLGRTEVTQGQWQEVMHNNPTADKGNINNHAAVANLSWNDAMEFCRRLTETERKADRIPKGYAYTLPTLAQWQYACLAGNGSWLDTGNLGSYAWYVDNSTADDGSQGWTDRQPAVVGRLQPNPWGFYDMIGNVGEFCFDGLEVAGGQLRATTDPRITEHPQASGIALGSSYASVSAICNPPSGLDVRSRANRYHANGMRLALTPIPEWKPAEDDVAPGSTGLESSLAAKPADKPAEFLPGIQIAMLNRALRSQFGINDSVSGAAITEADGTSPHATLLPAGTVIQKVNGLQVLTAATAHRPLQPGKNVLLVGQQGSSRPLILMLDEAYLGDTGSADLPFLVTTRTATTAPVSHDSASTILHPATALSPDVLHGTWALRTAGGRALDQQGADSWWTFDGDSFSAGFFGYLGHYVLDTSRSPATIDLKIEQSEGQPMDKLWPGLIELKDGRLRIALAPPTISAEPPRPRDFANPSDGHYGVLEFTKVK